MPGEDPDKAIETGPESAPEIDAGQSSGVLDGLGMDPLAIVELLRSGAQDPVKAMLGALGGSNSDNPQLAVLLDALQAQRSDDTAERHREELREEIEAEHAEAVAELAATASQTFAELELCRGRIEGLAAALGACPHCFGSDPLCNTCGGAGTPGSRLPQPSEFERYVRPAVERVRAALREVAPSRPWPNGGARRRQVPPSPNQAGAST